MVDTTGLIQGNNVADIVDFIVMMYGASVKKNEYRVEITIPKMDTMVRVIENDWGDDTASGIKTIKGDVYLKMLCSSRSIEIMKCIVSRFGGYMEERDYDEEQIPVAKNNRGVVLNYFKSWSI